LVVIISSGCNDVKYPASGILESVSASSAITIDCPCLNIRSSCRRRIEKVVKDFEYAKGITYEEALKEFMTPWMKRNLSSILSVDELEAA